jgi:hypothetical protein
MTQVRSLLLSSPPRSLMQLDEFGYKLGQTLEGIRMNIPRVFVQITEIFNISQV